MVWNSRVQYGGCAAPRPPEPPRPHQRQTSPDGTRQAKRPSSLLHWLPNGEHRQPRELTHICLGRVCLPERHSRVPSIPPFRRRKPGLIALSSVTRCAVRLWGGGVVSRCLKRFDSMTRPEIQRVATEECAFTVGCPRAGLPEISLARLVGLHIKKGLYEVVQNLLLVRERLQLSTPCASNL